MTELYYMVNKPEYDDSNWNYQKAVISVFEVLPEEREWNDKYHPNEKYVSDDNKIISLSYQRDRSRDINGNETTDQNKKVVSRWYAEDISHIKRDFHGISSEKIARVSKLFKKMEIVQKRIYDKGLSIQDGNDDLISRLFLLKSIGAKEIYYNFNSHNYSHSTVFVGGA